LRPPLAYPRNYLRFVMMEQPPSAELKKDFGTDRHLLRSYGAVLGQNRIRIYPDKNKPGGVKTKAIPNFELEKWFWREEHTRAQGNIFFIHTKYMLIDPLTEDPIVCTGSANFSKNSLVANDENMVLIRGETRVSDIYLTEFDRLFRHFFFRDVANETAGEGKAKAEKGAFLEEKPSVDWTAKHFDPKSQKCWRREMFFVAPVGTWAGKAGARAQDESAQQGIAAEAEDKVAAKKKRAAKKAAKTVSRKAVKKVSKKSAKKATKVKPKKVATKAKKKPAKKAAAKSGSKKPGKRR
jgi:phosphatidylserine/phosphatidylglycerophosphate/cardiolipin synthase-like enzyme